MNQRLLELALRGLEAERSNIEQEINDLKAQMNGRTGVRGRRRSSAAPVAVAGTKNSPSVARKTRRGLTAAGRRRLSELAKKRWAANRKLGKSTL